jgi:hypothetical protein
VPRTRTSMPLRGGVSRPACSLCAVQWHPVPALYAAQMRARCCCSYIDFCLKCASTGTMLWRVYRTTRMRGDGVVQGDTEPTCDTAQMRPAHVGSCAFGRTSSAQLHLQSALKARCIDNEAYMRSGGTALGRTLLFHAHDAAHLGNLPATPACRIMRERRRTTWASLSILICLPELPIIREGE